ncbi:MAG: DivIVA domain-containing protein [Acidimicrobiia bacterium]|nr:DivIVA domain-containing protein [Acidimicrobiia bacterium]
MELTPQQLCDVEFSEQWRGYSRDQVDDFIERVAAAVSDLQARLRKMTERAVRAEQRSKEGTEADGAARRTLVLAQRTADATVAEAKETAARLIAQAQEEARAMILAAETAVDTVPSTEPTARAEIADLEVTRSRLQADVAALESHVTDRRARIKDLLDELQRRVDEGLDGRIAQWPSPEDRILTGDQQYDDETDAFLVDAFLVDAGLDAAVNPTAVDAIAVDATAASFDATGEAESDRITLHERPLVDDDERSVVTDLGDAAADGTASGAADAAVDPAPVSEWDIRANGEPHEARRVPTPVPGDAELSARDVDDDTYFAQLRGALDDDAPLGPREDATGVLRWREEAATAVAEAPSLYDQGQPERRKFGRKKRRQQ